MASLVFSRKDLEESVALKEISTILFGKKSKKKWKEYFYKKDILA